MLTIRRIHSQDGCVGFSIHAHPANRHLTEKDIETAIEVLDVAFKRKYFLSALGHPSLCRVLIRTHLTTAFVENGAFVDVIESAEDGICGVAVWFGPGSYWLNNERQREGGGWNALMKQLDPSNVDWWENCMVPSYNEYCERAFGPGVKLAGYHLQLIGIRPEHQRKGLARQLITAVEKLAKSDGVCSLIDTIGGPEPGDAAKVYVALGYDAKKQEPIRTIDPNRFMYAYGFKKTPDML